MNTYTEQDVHDWIRGSRIQVKSTVMGFIDEASYIEQLSPSSYRLRLSSWFYKRLTYFDQRDPLKIDAYGQALVESLLCHVLYTDFSAQLSSKHMLDGLRARAVHLFEAARVQHRARAERPAFSFDWKRFNFEGSSAHTTPLGLLQELVDLELSMKPDPQAFVRKHVFWAGADKLTDGTPVVEKVVEFYLRACKAPTTADLLPIMIEFRQIFGQDVSELPFLRPVELDGKGIDLEDPWIKMDLGTNDGLPPPSGWTRWQDFLDADTVPTGYLDEQKVKQIRESMLALLVRQEPDNADLSDDGGSLNLGGALVSDPDALFHVKRDVAAGTRKVLLLLDMSGSMYAFWHGQGGKEFVAALVDLHRDCHIELKIILSGRSKRAEMLPEAMTRKVLCWLQPRSGDSLNRTLAAKRTKEHLAWAKTVLIWTDGDINYGEQVGFELAAQGVHIVAASTATHLRHRMLDQFPIVACDDSITRVASRCAEIILSGEGEQ